MIAALLLQTEQSPSTLTGSDVLSVLAMVFFGFVALLLLLRERQKRRRLKALRDAHNPKPPNVYGKAGEVSKEDARGKGWIG